MADLINLMEKNKLMIDADFDQLGHANSNISWASKMKNTSLIMSKIPCLMTVNKKVEEKGKCNTIFCMVGNRFALSEVRMF